MGPFSVMTKRQVKIGHSGEMKANLSNPRVNHRSALVSLAQLSQCLLKRCPLYLLPVAPSPLRPGQAAHSPAAMITLFALSSNFLTVHEDYKLTELYSNCRQSIQTQGKAITVLTRELQHQNVPRSHYKIKQEEQAAFPSYSLSWVNNVWRLHSIFSTC